MSLTTKNPDVVPPGSPFSGTARGESSYTLPPGRIPSGSYQQEDIWDEILGSDSHLVVEARAGTGKCLGIGTPVMLHDGSIVPVENVRVGDHLMGPDSLPRTVLSLSSGIGPLYRIVPVKGASWICNGEHILTLRDSVTKAEFDIPIGTYLDEMKKVVYRDAKLFRVGIAFPDRDTPVEPYLLGVWLGDGTCSKPSITNPEPEIIRYLQGVSASHGLIARVSQTNGRSPCPTVDLVLAGGQASRLGTKGHHITNPLREEFARCMVASEKRIPRDYLVNSRGKRLSLLAGLLDTDGHLIRSGYEIITKFDGLRDDILFLARSLGLAAYSTAKRGTIKERGFEGWYWRIFISGHCDEIPCIVARKKSPPRLQKKDVTNTGFVVDSIGDGPYRGFTLDGDGRFLLGDFTVTHNSSTCREAMHRLLESDPSLSGKLNYVAFNKSIADEFQAGLPPGARATTMHSAGYSALRNAFPSLGAPNKNKLRGIADRLLPRRDNLSRKAKTIAIRLAERCKSQLIGCDPKGQRYGIGPNVLRRMATEAGIDCRGSELTAFGLVDDILKLALKETASVDFSDMVWLPVMLELDFPESSVLFVDESQDLSPCEHSLVRRIAGDGRMVVVGDPRQSIYLFKGACSSSMATLAEQLGQSSRGVTRLPLTATRRCPVSHVNLARKIVSDFESLPGAPQGRWEADVDPEDVIEPGWFVLCRKNAPLLGLAFRSVARNIPVAIQGKDIGEQLGRFVDDLEGATVAALIQSVESYRATELAKLSEMDDVDEEITLVNDRCDCIRAASVGASTPSDISGKIRSLFKDVSKAEQGSYVLFSSVHRAKGREAERVAILEPENMPSPFARSPSAIEQEHNILYVSITRSKHRLSFLGPIPNPLLGV